MTRTRLKSANGIRYSAISCRPAVQRRTPFRSTKALHDGAGLGDVAPLHGHAQRGDAGAPAPVAHEDVVALLGAHPKGTDFSKLTDEMPAEIEWKLNHRPRKSLGYRTPLEYCKRFFNFDF